MGQRRRVCKRWRKLHSGKAMQFDSEAFGSAGHAFIGGNEFGGPKLEGGGNMDAVTR